MSGMTGLLANLVAEHLPQGSVVTALQPRLPYEFDVLKKAPADDEPSAPRQPRDADTAVRMTSPSPAVRIERVMQSQSEVVPATQQQPSAAVTSSGERAALRDQPPGERSVEQPGSKAALVPATREALPTPAPAPTTREIPHIVRETRVAPPADARQAAKQGESSKESSAAPPRTRSVMRAEASALRPRSAELPPPAPLRAAAMPEPVIEIHIGRVEVRSDRGGKSSAVGGDRATSAVDRSLAHYLRGRGSGARS